MVNVQKVDVINFGEILKKSSGCFTFVIDAVSWRKNF